jgi:hypothetical protein
MLRADGATAERVVAQSGADAQTDGSKFVNGHRFLPSGGRRKSPVAAVEIPR